MGIQGTGQTYFICWDGATDNHHGPFILPLKHELSQGDRHQTNGSTASFCVPSEVMPLMNHVKYPEKVTNQSSCHRTGTQEKPLGKLGYGLPSFLHEGITSSYSPKDPLSMTLDESIKMMARMEGGIDDIIVHALDSISTTSHHSSSDCRRVTVMSGGGSSRVNHPKVFSMSHHEKSQRLLGQCSSWAQLDDTKTNREQGQGKNRE